jgi:ATP-dependent DNA helicase RecG
LDSQLTNAGYLLFGKRPQDLFPQAHVRVLRFLVAERGTGSRLGLEDSSDIRIDGPIPYVVQQATKVIDELMPRRRSLTASGRFEAVPVVPRDVWLEGLVNAVIHRSYSLAGDHIRGGDLPEPGRDRKPRPFPWPRRSATSTQDQPILRNPRIAPSAPICASARNLGKESGGCLRRCDGSA